MELPHRMARVERGASEIAHQALQFALAARAGQRNPVDVAVEVEFRIGLPVVPAGFLDGPLPEAREGEELRRHDGANGVEAVIIRTGAAVAVTVESG